MEDGIDTKNVIEQYSALKKEHQTLQDKTEKKIGKLQKLNQKLNKNYQEAMEQLQR